MLPEHDLPGDQDIVADNIRVVQAIWFAQQLENMRAFDVVDRLVQLFQQGQLPLGRGPGRRLLRSLATTDRRLAAQARRMLYARALGVPGGDAGEAQPNRDFPSLWLRFVASVALFERQRGLADLTPRLAAARARVWRAARALAVLASVHGAGLADATKRLAVEANRLRALLDASDIQQAYGARDMWQVIDQVATNELGGAADVVRYRRRALAGSALLHWLAEHADALKTSSLPPAGLTVPDQALTDAVDAWLASHGGHDKTTDDPVRVDLRQSVSKYIGETEKNLDAVFDQVRRFGAALMFDEADALFGRRSDLSDVSDAHDRYVSDEIDFLQQRLQATSGVVSSPARAGSRARRLPASSPPRR